MIPTGSVFRISTSAREIFELCNARDSGGGRVTTRWTAESLMQVLGVWRSAVFRWKHGLRIAATSYSGPGQCNISGVTPAPVSVYCSRSDYVCCSGGINLPRSDCVIQLLPLHKQLDSHPYDLMMEFVKNYGSGSSYSHSSASVIGLVINSYCCAGRSTLVDRTVIVLSFFAQKHLGEVAWTCALGIILTLIQT